MTSSLRLDASGLDAAFPFHFVLDDGLAIVATGRVLRRLLPTGIEHTPVDTLFECVRTPAELTLREITADPERCWLLRAKQVPSLVLRGQFVPTADGTVLFVGGPRIDIDTLKELGLTLNDFAAHDAAGDFIFLVNAQQASLADAARLSDELGRLNVELEDRVKARTVELSTANAQLMRTASDLVSTLEPGERAYSC